MRPFFDTPKVETYSQPSLMLDCGHLRTDVLHVIPSEFRVFTREARNLELPSLPVAEDGGFSPNQGLTWSFIKLYSVNPKYSLIRSVVDSEKPRHISSAPGPITTKDVICMCSTIPSSVGQGRNHVRVSTSIFLALRVSPSGSNRRATPAMQEANALTIRALPHSPASQWPEYCFCYSNDKPLTSALRFNAPIDSEEV